MYSVEYVIDTRTGNQISSDDILPQFNLSTEKKSDMRTEVLQKVKEGSPIFLCGFCKQAVYLCGGRHTGKTGKSFREIHFKHFHHSPDCKFYLKTKYSKSEIEKMKFHGLKEGILHKTLKEEITLALNKEGYNAKEEEVVSTLMLYKDGVDSESYKRLWRRPDVRAKGLNKQFVIEIQLATTFLSVILERMNFYKESKNHILWILNHFNPKAEQKFTTMDILSLTNRNIFEFNDEMRQKTIEQGKLILKCHYEIPILQEDLTFRYDWKNKVVCIDDLVFDDEHYIAYYYDCWNEEKRLLKEKNNKITHIVKSSTNVKDTLPYWSHDSEEELQIMIEKDMIPFHYNEDLLNILTSLREKDFSNITNIFYKIRKCKIKLPQLENAFFSLLIRVTNEFSEYKEAAINILCHEGFDYDIEEVFDDEVGNYQTAWNFTDSSTDLRKFLLFFYQRGYTIPVYLLEKCQEELLAFKKNKNKKISENERYKIEKCLLVTMWDKLQKLDLPKYIKMLEEDKVLLFIIRLTSYTLKIPLGCAHPNLAALTGTMKASHASLAHLTIDMINACGLDKDEKLKRNYSSLQQIALTNQDHSYDNLVHCLFNVFDKKDGSN